MKNRHVSPCAVLPLLGALLAATPAAAQTASGPVVPRAEFARLTATPRLDVPVAADGLAERLDPSKPRLYFSAPLAALLGVGGMVVGYVTGLVVFDCHDEARACANAPANFEYTLAYTGLAFGAATGAHLGGKRRDSEGRFLATLGGAAVGALPILLVPKEQDDQNVTYVGSMAAGTAGAVLVDYLVRQPRH